MKLKKFFEEYNKKNILTPSSQPRLSKSVQGWLQKRNNFILKERNLPHSPRAQYSVLCNYAYADGWQAHSMEKLFHSIENKLQDIVTDIVNKMIHQVPCK